VAFALAFGVAEIGMTLVGSALGGGFGGELLTGFSLALAGGAGLAGVGARRGPRAAVGSSGGAGPAAARALARQPRCGARGSAATACPRCSARGFSAL
jgi:hypothetical protein